MSVSTSIDGLVMVLLGGVETVSGPIVGAIVYKLLSIWLVSHTDYSKLVLGLVIIGLVLVFPKGIAGSIRLAAAARGRGADRESAGMSALLEVRGLAKSYGGVQAVRGVSLAVASGEIVALIGPNGAGKSTCFNMLNGQIRPDAGTIRLDGRDIAGWPPREVWRLGVGRTFQITATFASMTRDRERPDGPAVARRPRHAGCGALATALSTASARSAARARRHARRRPTGPAAELAYGDLKRLELAMALANEPRLLLMDEPTAGMSPRDRVELMALTAAIAREKNLGVLFTEHDMDVVFRHADRVLVLSRGRLIAEGTPDEVRRNPEVQAVYLGEGLTYHGGRPP